jgi:hypothetical protein
VVVRPDGVVGWRAVDAADASSQAFRDVLASLLCRPAAGARSPAPAPAG